MPHHAHHRGNCKFRPLPSPKQLFDERSRFPAPLPRIFSERYQIQSELVPSRYGAVMHFRAPEKLTLCFHAAKELVDLTLTDQTCHFHILDQAHTADTSYSFYLQWQFSQPIENVTHINQDLFLTFSSKEVTVQLGSSYLSQDMAHSHLPNLSLEGC